MRASTLCGGATAAAVLTFVPVPTARAATFASSVPDNSYTTGNVFIASGQSYADPTAALAAPEPIVGADTAFAGVLSPFNAHYSPENLVAIGRGGSITLRYQNPVPVVAGPEVGVFTNASFPDFDYPNGLAPDPIQTSAVQEYGAERTAVVEVADALGNFYNVGRFTFDEPTNYFANATSPFQFPAPDPAVVADFGKPFAAPQSSFSGRTFGEILQILDGSAGGTWVDVPAASGLTEINYVRFSDPLWLLPDGTFAETRTSIYDPTYVKPADLFIDAVSGVPEPSGVVLLFVPVTALLRRRRRAGQIRERGPVG